MAKNIMVTLEELEPKSSKRKSFSGKAMVVTDGYGTETLFSYCTPVAQVDAENGKATLFVDWDYSNTTMVHVRDFLNQYSDNMGYDSAAQIRKAIEDGTIDYDGEMRN